MTLWSSNFEHVGFRHSGTSGSVSQQTRPQKLCFREQQAQQQKLSPGHSIKTGNVLLHCFHGIHAHRNRRCIGSNLVFFKTQGVRKTKTDFRNVFVVKNQL